ncbi:MAG: bifunctional nuclease family protein [Acidobacteria bacterium]|nr:bifunctional nuclease family protein [Acidobacteriota bacterium]
MEREVKIRALLVDPTTNSPIVLLKDMASESMVLPIWVGPYEANSIASEIEKVAPHRPMTHDLLRNAIRQLGGTVQRIVITDLQNNTFYAIIEILVEDKLVILDSRPSDAIALAMRVDCPIFVRDAVFEASGVDEVSRLPEEDEETVEDEVEWPEELDDITDYKM